MNINIFELLNVLIVVFLLLQLKRRRDVVALLVVLFMYGTLHFGFAAIALATNESASLLIALHNDGGGMLAKLSSLSLLSVVFALLGRRAYGKYLLSSQGERKITISILLVMVILAGGYWLNIRLGDWLQLKNVISLEAMLALILFGFLGANGAHTMKMYPAILAGLVILGITDCIAIYEVFDHRSWAGTLESSGAMVYRASSLLFNPNLFAFWASLVYLACAYGIRACNEHRKMMLWGMVFASIAIYFSGSRSSGYLLLGVLFIPALLVKERSHWLSVMVLPLTMLGIYVGTVWFVLPLVADSEGWYEIALLGERFAAAPIYLINYALMHIDIPLGIPAGITEGVPEGIPAEVAQSIEGRFIGESRDAGWLVLYQDVGWLGTSAMLGLSLLSLWLAMSAYLEKRSSASVYALATLCYCLLTGWVMRLQIFPVWLFVGIFLMPCLIFWARNTTLLNPDGNG
jgi:hypothetical protein